MESYYPKEPFDEWRGTWVFLLALLLVFSPVPFFSVPYFAIWVIANWRMLTTSESERDQARLEWERTNAQIERVEQEESERQQAAEFRAKEQARAESRQILAEIERRKKSQEDYLALSPRHFEEYVSKIFERAGWDVSLTPRSYDGGIDIRVKKGNLNAIVQCKRYKKPVGVAYVRELYGLVKAERVQAGFLITSSTFTKSAEEFAATKKPLHLWNFVKLMGLHERYFDSET